jgi:hypothetical protein
MINGSIQEIILAHLEKPRYNWVSVILGNGAAIGLTAQTEEPERLHDLVDLMRRLEAAAR